MLYNLIKSILSKTGLCPLAHVFIQSFMESLHPIVPYSLRKFPAYSLEINATVCTLKYQFLRSVVDNIFLTESVKDEILNQFQGIQCFYWRLFRFVRHVKFTILAKKKMQ